MGTGPSGSTLSSMRSSLPEDDPQVGLDERSNVHRPQKLAVARKADHLLVDGVEGPFTAQEPLGPLDAQRMVARLDRQLDRLFLVDRADGGTVDQDLPLTAIGDPTKGPGQLEGRGH